MCAQTVVLMPAAGTGAVIDDDLFAANTTFTSNYLDAGGAYDRMLQQLGWSGLRFPGGTITEEAFAPGDPLVDRFFDVTTPSGLAEDGSPRIVTVPAAFDYAAANDLTFHFTLPSKNYLTDEVDDHGHRVASAFGLYRLLDRADEIVRGVYGEITVTSFELGNEYWYAGDSIEPEAYGAFVDDMAIGLDALFHLYEVEQGPASDWTHPMISVQSAPGWIADGNDPIFGELSLAAREAIDAAITHFYPTSYTGIGTREAHFDRLQEWQTLEGITSDVTGAPKDVQLFVSEWNMQNGSDTGLVQASDMLEIFRTLVENEIDYAAVWGTQYFSLGSRLAELREDPEAPGGLDYALTAAGEVYRMMSEDLRGLTMLDLDTPAGLRSAIDVPQDARTPEQAEQLVMHAFANADTTIIFLSSRSEIDIDVTLDPSGLVPDFHHVWAEQLGVIDDPATPTLDEGDPLAKYADPYIRTLNADELAAPGGLGFTLGPYEVIQIEFTTGAIGVEMSGHDRVVDPAADYDDDFSGTAYADTIAGHAGDDTLRGHGGDDLLLGGDGNDYLGGWVGNDLLDGGAGDDTLVAGEGDDTLIARGGVNDLRGGEGVDQFIVDVAGQTRILDFDLGGGEGLSFLDHYADPQAVLDRTEVQGDDLVVLHDGGGETRLVGLGGQAAEFGGALSDFQEGAPVADLVDLLTTSPPDGSIAPDPPPVPETGPPPPFTEADLVELLTLEDPLDVAAFVAVLTPEEEASMLDLLNANALALSASPALWGAFCNTLTDEGFDRFIDDIDAEVLSLRYARITADEYANGPDQLIDPEGLPLCRTMLEVDEITRLDYYLVLSDTERGDIEQAYADRNPDLPGLTAAEIFGLDSGAIDARRAELLETDAKPAFARFLLPGAYDTDYLDDADDDDGLPPDVPPEEEEPPEEEVIDDGGGGGGGGGCFVATCAYGDADHPDVVFLRRYRDLELSRHAAGRAFIRAYDAVGPWIAAAIGPFPALRALARRGLMRLVRGMRRRRMARRAA